MPDTPPPIIAKSRTPSRCVRFSNPASFTMVCTARAPVSDENFNSGIPVKSPTMYRPDTAVDPSSFISGNFSTVPDGQRVCNQCVYRFTNPTMARSPNRRLGIDVV